MLTQKILLFMISTFEIDLKNFCKTFEIDLKNFCKTFEKDFKFLVICISKIDTYSLTQCGLRDASASKNNNFSKEV